jgi:cell division protein FtsI/penicillin-binding protein 2
VKIDVYTIQDADKTACIWYHSFLDALVNSCNVWMIRIVQSLGKEIFYNYLAKLGFWEKTWIELASEKSGTLPNATNASMATFFNNAFWQWVTVTQIQLASAYSTLVNWWTYIKPTIISQIREKSTDTDNTFKQWKSSHSVIRREVSEEMRNALFSVLTTNSQYESARVGWYRLGAKSWTSQIAYKWRYKKWVWWTQATFAW